MHDIVAEDLKAGKCNRMLRGLPRSFTDFAVDFLFFFVCCPKGHVPSCRQVLQHMCGLGDEKD
jgi:hypothetical protein